MVPRCAGTSDSLVYWPQRMLMVVILLAEQYLCDRFRLDRPKTLLVSGSLLQLLSRRS